MCGSYQFRPELWETSGAMNSVFLKQRQMPKRQGIRYSRGEEEDLFRAWLFGHSFRYIAFALQRKPEAVYGRWQRIMRKRGQMRNHYERHNHA